jgi:hypothetical protein
MPTAVLLDCDPGHDDAIALLLALASLELELLGVNAQILPRLPGWREDFSTTPIDELAERLDAVPLIVDLDGDVKTYRRGR